MFPSVKPTAPASHQNSGSTRARIAGLFGFVGLLHLVAWGTFLISASRFPALTGLGALAYGLGLRHAFDADHISAIDDSTRYLLQKGQRPLATGFFFSLGHSTIVLIMTVALVVAATFTRGAMPYLRSYGGVMGALAAGAFLWLIGILNLLVMLDLLTVRDRMNRGAYRQERLEDLLARRGLLRRVLGGRLRNLINHSWQMFPVGLLFGLGFDTASEIALLALAAGAASQAVPVVGVTSLALLFASGMSLMDTADGVFMVGAYGWVLSDPLRKINYNLATTGLSVAIALGIGTIELLQVLAAELSLHGRYTRALAGLNFETIGVAIVAVFVAGWALAGLRWRLRRIEEGLGT